VKIVLCGIVRQEADNIIRTLESFRSVADKVILTDTGSTDGTPELVREWLARTGMPGVIYSVPWEAYAEAQGLPTRPDGSPALFDFARARNTAVALALQHCEDIQSDWLFEIDSTWELKGGVGSLRAGLENAPQDLTAFEIMVHQTGASIVPYLRLRRARECGPSGWRWEFPIHEYLWRADNVVIGRIEGIWVSHCDTERSAANRKARVLRDIVIFEEVIADYDARGVASRDFSDHERGLLTRAWFYLAQSFEQAERLDDAYAAFKKRAELQGAVHEWAQSAYRAGRVLMKRPPTQLSGDNVRTAIAWFLESFAISGRPEGLWEAAEAFKAIGDTDSAENTAWLAFEAAKGQKPDASSGFSYPEAFALASFGPVRDTAMVSARIRSIGLMGIPFPGKVTG
jgi:hypothetical protein